MTIFEVVEELKEKYGTTDPFVLCEYLGVKVSISPLGSLKGLYTSLREFTFFNMRDKTEAEANRFLANLNIDDDELDTLFREGRSVTEAAQILCFPEELLNIKIADMVRRGYEYENYSGNIRLF